MNWLTAAKIAVHPSLDRFLHQCRDGNPDADQMQAARATLLRLAGVEVPMPTARPPYYAPRCGCGGGGCTR